MYRVYQKCCMAPDLEFPYLAFKAPIKNKYFTQHGVSDVVIERIPMARLKKMKKKEY